MNIIIRPATQTDALFLISMSFGAKRYINYNQNDIRQWKDNLSITSKYVEENIVLVAEINGIIVGYCAVKKINSTEDNQYNLKEGYCLEDLFVRPAYANNGIGTKMLEELINYCRIQNVKEFYIVSERSYDRFYKKMGAIYIGSIEQGENHFYQYTYSIAQENQEDDIPLEQHKTLYDQKDKKDKNFVGGILEKQLSELDMNGVLDLDEVDNEEKNDEELDDEELDLEEGNDEEIDNEERYASRDEYRDDYSDEDSDLEAYESSQVEVKLQQEERVISIAKHSRQEQIASGEYKKRADGELYIPWGDEIANERSRARKLLREFNNADPDDKMLTYSILTQLFGSVGEYLYIEPTFNCCYGYNIHVGNNFFADYNCVILDQGKVTIGNNCMISPQVGIYTVKYPLEVEKRIAGYECVSPVTIGDNVWIGGGSIINPGVTIGNNVVIQAGSVVISDIPDNVLVGGNPARVITEIVSSQEKNRKDSI